MSPEKVIYKDGETNLETTVYTAAIGGKNPFSWGKS
jgi:hypothetical protein